LAQRFLVFQEQSQPFGVFEAARFGLGIEVLEAFGHTVKTETMQQVEGTKPLANRPLSCL
jgi:hypothetical protein